MNLNNLVNYAAFQPFFSPISSWAFTGTHQIYTLVNEIAQNFFQKAPSIDPALTPQQNSLNNGLGKARTFTDLCTRPSFWVSNDVCSLSSTLEEQDTPLISAAREGNLEAVKAILTEQTIEPDERDRALLIATTMGHTATGWHLFEKVHPGETFSLSRLVNHAMPMAIKRRSINALQKILAAYSTEIHSLRSSLTYKAASDGTAEMLALLLKKIPFVNELSGSLIAYHLEKAKVCDIEIIRLLLANGPINLYDRGGAVISATRIKNSEVVRMLLEDGTIEESSRGRSVKIAVENRDTSLIHMLLENGPIPDVHKGEAVASAIRSSQPEIIEMLFANGPIEPSWYTDALKNAIYRRDLPILLAFLTSAPSALLSVFEVPLHLLSLLSPNVAMISGVAGAAIGIAIYNLLIAPTHQVQQMPAPMNQQWELDAEYDC